MKRRHQTGAVSGDRAGRGHLGGVATRHPWWVLGVWAAFFAVLTPTALHYTTAVSYSGASNALAGSESTHAAAVLAGAAAGRSTLLVVVSPLEVTNQSVWNATLAFQAALSSARIPYENGSSSLYSSYAAYLDNAFGGQVAEARSAYSAVKNLSAAVYGFPAAFLANWSVVGATRDTINATFVQAGGSGSSYDSALRDWLWSNFSAAPPAATLVQSSVRAVAPGFFGSSPMLDATLNATNVSAYQQATPTLVQASLALTGQPPVPTSWIRAAAEGGDFGLAFVHSNGATGAPPFLAGQYRSPDGAVEVVLVTFNVSESFRTPAGGYPAQLATPTVRSLADARLGSAAVVTGSGAVAYDAQQLENGAGILFALTFVLLAVAVAVTLRSWIAPLLALVVISLSEVLGYLAIELTGALVGKVDFTVTYTLTAVTLGVATDYLLFVCYRYREELTRGEPPATALHTAARSSGFAILVSSLTVAVGLGTLSFLSGLQTWGPVLFLSVAAIGLLELTLLPALLRLVGPRLFLARWLRPASPPETSRFYRAARASTSRPGLILLLAALVAVPAVLGFLLVPTTYDFTGNLPATTQSSQGEHLLESSFGSNLLFPAYVLVPAPAAESFLSSNGSLSPAASSTLMRVAADLVSRPGVASVAGPFAAGRGLTNGTGATTYLLDNGRYALYVVEPSDGPYSASTIDLVTSLRANSSYLVGGVTSSVIDQQDLNATQFPALELLLTLFLGVILGLAFRSAAVPLVSLSGVFLSIASTTGILYLLATFVLHQPLVYLIPLILFVILFSLGNDYTVFLLARIREEQGRSGPVEGIHRGIAGSGVVVSALGLILAASLGSLALQPLAFLQQIGIAFVISLVIDTFLIRPFYFPALLGLRERASRRRPDRPLGGLALSDPDGARAGSRP